MDREIMIAKLFFRAAFPVMKVPLADDPAITNAWKDVKATVQFSADCEPGPDTDGQSRIGACLHFDNGSLEVVEELCESPDLTLHFGSVKAMNTLLSGGMALPRIRGGLKHPGLLVKMLTLLMRLTLMLPTNRPKDPVKRYLKVKMSIYMITTALSNYNRLGDPKMREWTANQPDRIYQFTIATPERDDNIAAYLRIRGGRTKSGRGVYTRRRPFVHFRFSSVDGALKVLLKEVEFVQGVESGCVAIDGSPEYAAKLNDFMAVIQGMMT
ncbi:MAG TPA: hypothetical protein PLY68_06310 [Myxococcota bacterium]|nr:hypothetical protein [Myxococcota bacterium]